MSELEWTDEQHDAYQLGMLTEREHQNALSRFAMEKHEDELIALRDASRITDATLTGDLEMARDRIRELEKQLAWKEGLIRQLTEVDMPALEGQLAALQAATPVVATLSPTERGIIEAMVEDWLQLYEPGSDEWDDAKKIDAWLAETKGSHDE